MSEITIEFKGEPEEKSLLQRLVRTPTVILKTIKYNAQAAWKTGATLGGDPLVKQR